MRGPFTYKRTPPTPIYAKEHACMQFHSNTRAETACTAEDQKLHRMLQHISFCILQLLPVNYICKRHTNTHHARCDGVLACSAALNIQELRYKCTQPQTGTRTNTNIAKHTSAQMKHTQQHALLACVWLALTNGWRCELAHARVRKTPTWREHTLSLSHHVSH